MIRRRKQTGSPSGMAGLVHTAPQPPPLDLLTASSVHPQLLAHCQVIFAPLFLRASIQPRWIDDAQPDSPQRIRRIMQSVPPKPSRPACFGQPYFSGASLFNLSCTYVSPFFFFFFPFPQKLFHLRVSARAEPAWTMSDTHALESSVFVILPESRRFTTHRERIWPLFFSISCKPSGVLVNHRRPTPSRLNTCGQDE